jgi:hypothetical protein
MPKLDKLTVGWTGLVPVFSDLVSKWKPAKLKTEAAYRNDLLALIRESVPDDAKVEKEFRHRGTTMDIWVGWKGMFSSDELAFELKVNLKKKTDFDRLIGQIEGLEPTKNKTLVVLIGETDGALLGRLKEKYAELLNPITGNEIKLAIVLVAVSENAP